MLPTYKVELSFADGIEFVKIMFVFIIFGRFRKDYGDSSMP